MLCLYMCPLHFKFSSSSELLMLADTEHGRSHKGNMYFGMILTILTKVMALNIMRPI